MNGEFSVDRKDGYITIAVHLPVATLAELLAVKKCVGVFEAEITEAESKNPLETDEELG